MKQTQAQTTGELGELEMSGNSALSTVDHGRTISEEEYQRQIVRLYEEYALSSSSIDNSSLRRKELDLTIDYRLGRDFPLSRREALWEVAEQLERERLRLGAMVILHWVFDRIASQSSGGYLTSLIVRRYAAVLSPAEIEVYLGAQC